MRSIVPPLGMSVVLQLLLLQSLQAQLQEQAGLRLELGVLGGFEFTQGVEDPRLGPQVHIGAGPIGLTAAFALIEEELPLEWTGGAWQLYLTGSVRPFGARSWLSLGYGLTIRRRWAQWDFLGRTDPIYSRTNTTDAVTIGVAVSFARLRPFADLYLTRLLDRDGQVGGHALFGFLVEVL